MLLLVVWTRKENGILKTEGALLRYESLEGFILQIAVFLELFHPRRLRNNLGDA
jgi:hypothetical protein